MNLLNILANKKNIIYLVLITILYIILFCQNLDSYHFLDFFETKFTTIAKEMIANNSSFAPTLNGANNFDTPPLFFWIVNLFCYIFPEKIYRDWFMIVREVLCMFRHCDSIQNLNYCIRKQMEFQNILC